MLLLRNYLSITSDKMTNIKLLLCILYHVEIQHIKSKLLRLVFSFAPPVRDPRYLGYLMH